MVHDLQFLIIIQIKLYTVINICLIRRRIAHRSNDLIALIEAWLHRRRYFFILPRTLQLCKISFINENVQISQRIMTIHDISNTEYVSKVFYSTVVVFYSLCIFLIIYMFLNHEWFCITLCSHYSTSGFVHANYTTYLYLFDLSSYTSLMVMFML